MATGTPKGQQYHNHWGVYTEAANLPNAAGNALSGGEYDKLQEGDIAYSNDSGSEALYVCKDPGTDGDGNAEWLELASV